MRMPRLAKTWPDSGCSTFSLPHPQSSASIKKMALIPQKHSYGSPSSGRMWHRAAPRGAHVLTAINTHPVHPFGVWQLEGCSPTPSVQTDTAWASWACLAVLKESWGCKNASSPRRDHHAIICSAVFCSSSESSFAG